jgi:hypothetical protein
MAYYEECSCVKCTKSFGRIVDDQIDKPRTRAYFEPKICPDCLDKENEEKVRERENRRDKWLFKRGDLTIEQRIREIEEWIYDYGNIER